MSRISERFTDDNLPNLRSYLEQELSLAIQRVNNICKQLGKEPYWRGKSERRHDAIVAQNAMNNKVRAVSHDIRHESNTIVVHAVQAVFKVSADGDEVNPQTMEKILQSCDKAIITVLTKIERELIDER